MTDAVASYLDDLFGEEDATLQAARAHLKRNKLPPISIHPRLGRLLGLLVRIKGAKRILEIGTLGGISAIYLARALPADGSLVTIEIGADTAAIAEKNFELAGVADRVEVAVGDACDILPTLKAPFDLLYIDADKAEYPEYLDLALPLLQPSSLIIADDVLRRGKPLNPAFNDSTTQGLIKFNKRISRDSRLESLILPDIADYSWHGLDGVALALVN